MLCCSVTIGYTVQLRTINPFAKWKVYSAMVGYLYGVHFKEKNNVYSRTCGVMDKADGINR
jgi:hypothetical protein